MLINNSRICFECENKYPGICNGYCCGGCGKALCGNSLEGHNSSSVENLDMRSCSFCSGGHNIDDDGGGGGRRIYGEKIYPTPTGSPEPPSPYYLIGEKCDGNMIVNHISIDINDFPPNTSMICSSFATSTSRSDGEEGGDSERHFFCSSNECSFDMSDLDTISSVSGRNEFYSYKSMSSSPSDSPSRINFTPFRSGNYVQKQKGSPKCQDYSRFSKEATTILKMPETEVQEDLDDLSILKDHQFEHLQEPLDFENNALIWFPPPPVNEDDEADTSFLSDNDDDDMGQSCGVFSSNMFAIKNYKHDVVNKGPPRSVVQGHFRVLVSQLLQGEAFTLNGENSIAKWLDIITKLAWEAANFVKTDASSGGSMDPGDYVKVKCLALGTPPESALIKGVVCTKNIKHKRMTSQYKTPRLFLLGGALEYQKVPNQLASFDTLLQQEIDHLKLIVSKIEARRPNVILVEKSVSSYAQEYLLAKDISLVLNVKKSLLERIARCTGAVISPSIDNIPTTRLGNCDLFRVERVSEEYGISKQSNKRPKTLMFFEGCPRRLGCTVLLKGACCEELKKVKHVVQYAVFAAYHLSLETSFLADEGASLPKKSSKSLPAVPGAIAENANSSITDSSNPIISPQTGTFIPQNEGSKGHKDWESLSMNHYDCSSLLTTSMDFRAENPPYGAQCDDLISDTKVLLDEMVEECQLNVKTMSEMNDKDEYLLATDNHQSILVAFSSHRLNGTVCERSSLLRVKFYGCFDKPLGRYLFDDLFSQRCYCRYCNELAEGHVRHYTHQQGILSIHVRRLPSLNLPLPGERDGKIWMWHRCLKCSPINGIPPATQRIVMSDAAWGLSFGKFLELSFSNHTTANRVAGCGHSLQKDCLRFYGFGNMVALFRYSPINVLSVHLPPPIIRFNGSAQFERVKEEATELKAQMEALYTEISEVLTKIEQKMEISKKDELCNHVFELKNMVKTEMNDFAVLLQSDDPMAIDFLELNRVRRSLLICCHTWDRRLYVLDSLAKSSSGDNKDDPELKVYDVDGEYLPISSRSNSESKHGKKPGMQSDGQKSEASSLYDRIDSVWTGSSQVMAKSQSFSSLTSTQPCGSQLNEIGKDNPSSRRLMKSPARVYSFEGVINRGSSIASLQDHPPRNTESFATASKLFCLSNMSREGVHVLLPCPERDDLVIVVYDDEPASMISYALSSREYRECVTDDPSKRDKDREASKPSTFDAWQSFGSSNLDYIRYGGDDFASVVGMLFRDPPDKSPHLSVSYSDDRKARFGVTCYFAKQFDALRRICCPGDVDFVCSLSRCRRWKADGGKSKVYFAQSLDGRFILKEVTKTEFDSFQEFALEYFKYMAHSLNTKAPTCLAKILGVYQVKHARGGKEVKMNLMVMENLFFNRNISRVYDLKGSTRSRYNEDKTGTNKVLLDMNLMETLRTKPMFLGSTAKRNLERAVWNDTSFLAGVDVMDYSLLVGVDEEGKELVVGIIDYMRQYTWDKHLETWVKASGILGGPKNASPTIVSPHQYKQRFRKAMTTYFLTIPDQLSMNCL